MALKVKSILISQPEPIGQRSPYYDLWDKYKVKIDFRPFIHVDPVSAKEFRRSKVRLDNYNAIIFNSRTAIQHFFRLTEELRYEVPDSKKYFCANEAIAVFLQKFVTYRKRKVFFPIPGEKTFNEILLKYKNDKFLFPKSNVSKDELPSFLKKNKFKFAEATMFKTVCSDLSDLADVNYDIIAFFSPSGIKSLFQNFPDFEQKNTRIAGFGPTTCQAIKEAGLDVNIKAPSQEAPSMLMALENYIKNEKKE